MIVIKNIKKKKKRRVEEYRLGDARGALLGATCGFAGYGPQSTSYGSEEGFT